MGNYTYKRYFLGKLQMKRQHERRMLRWDYDTKLDLKRRLCKDVAWIYVAQIRA